MTFPFVSPFSVDTFFTLLSHAIGFIDKHEKFNFTEAWINPRRYSVLVQPEDFRVLNCERSRIMCAIWYLLSRHQFHEASKLLVYAVSNYSITPSWIWRVSFHIFDCVGDFEDFKQFNYELSKHQLTDENNRILEAILRFIERGQFNAVQHYNITRPSHSAVRRLITSFESAKYEPELTYVQRLQRLYEGLSMYAEWLQLSYLHRQREQEPDEAGDSRPALDEYDHQTSRQSVEELAEKACYRLIETEHLINDGYLCDIFLEPLIELLKYLNRQSEALRLLRKYRRAVPENPNTLRFLEQWYQPPDIIINPPTLSASSACSSPPLIKSPSRNAFPSPTKTTPTIKVIEDSSRLKIVKSEPTTSTPQSIKRWLGYRVKLARHILPYKATPRPADGEESELQWLQSTGQDRDLVTISLCLTHNLMTSDALELAFLHLDHPSWASFAEPWRLLKKAIKVVGLQSLLLAELWSPSRQYYWSRLQFTVLDTTTNPICKAARFVRKTLLALARDNNATESVQDSGPFGPPVTLRLSDIVAPSSRRQPLSSDERQLNTSGEE